MIGTTVIELRQNLIPTLCMQGERECKVASYVDSKCYMIPTISSRAFNIDITLSCILTTVRHHMLHHVWKAIFTRRDLQRAGGGDDAGVFRGKRAVRYVD